MRYINVSSHESDTFNYEDIHKTSSNLLTINMGISGIYDFVGAKFDIGFIPFANRNYNLSFMSFLLMSLHDDLAISPEFGYTRLRKKKVLGKMEKEEDKYFDFENSKVHTLQILTHQVSHSYFLGLGIYIGIGNECNLYLSGHYHKIFRTRSSVKVIGDDNYGGDIGPLHSHRFKMNDQNVSVKDSYGHTISKYYNPGLWSFTAQICIPLYFLESERPLTIGRLLGF